MFTWDSREVRIFDRVGRDYLISWSTADLLNIKPDQVVSDQFATVIASYELAAGMVVRGFAALNSQRTPSTRSQRRGHAA